MGVIADISGRPCLNCGHSPEDHACFHEETFVTHDGAVINQSHYGACQHIDEDTLQECPCQDWDPDTLSRVTELLGFDVRSVI